MKTIVLAFWASVTLAIVVAPATAGTSPPGSFEEAGRMVDQLAGRLGTFGAELAQQIQQGMRGLGVPGPMGRPMSEPAGRPLITIMLHHRSELGLTPEQVTRLEALRGEFSREAIRRTADIRIGELDLATLLEQEPTDLSKVETKVREVAQLRADLRIARLRAIEQGKATLTPDQRTRLQTLLSGMQHHGPGGAPAPRRSADTGALL
jgi:Spy/CpxP family protein refolding chaperone